VVRVDEALGHFADWSVLPVAGSMNLTSHRENVLFSLCTYGLYSIFIHTVCVTYSNVECGGDIVRIEICGSSTLIDGDKAVVEMLRSR